MYQSDWPAGRYQRNGVTVTTVRVACFPKRREGASTDSRHLVYEPASPRSSSAAFEATISRTNPFYESRLNRIEDRGERPYVNVSRKKDARPSPSFSVQNLGEGAEYIMYWGRPYRGGISFV